VVRPVWAPLIALGGVSVSIAFGAAIPVCGDLGDQQAALFGQTCFERGEAKHTYGTGNFILLNTGDEIVKSKSGSITTCAYAIEQDTTNYALEGSIAVTGAAVQWLRDELGIIRDAAETAALAASIPDSGGVYLVPAFAGLGAPYWDQYARGTVVGLTRGAGRAHLARATLEAACYQTRDVLEVMRADAALPILELRVDGGMAVNDMLLQLQADSAGLRVVRVACTETTALGGAYQAGLRSGYWSGQEELSRLWAEDRGVKPGPDDAARAKGYRGWQRAVERARDWARDDA